MKTTNGIRMKALTAGLLAALLAALSVPVSASDYADLPTDAKVQSYQDQLTALQERQAQATAELQALHTEQGNAWEEKLKLDELINITTQQKQLAEKQIESINSQIEEKQQAIEETSARIEAQQDAFYERMVDSYTEKKTDYLELVLGAENLVDFLTKFDYVVNILEGDRKIISKLETDKETLASDQAILEEALNIQLTLVADYEKAIGERQLLNNSLDEYIETLSANSDDLIAVISQNQQKQAEVQDDLAQRIAQVNYENELAKEAERKRLEEEAAERRRQEEEWRRQQEAEADRQRQEEEWRRQQEEAAAEAERQRQEAEWLRQQQAAAEAEEQSWDDWSGNDGYYDDGSSWTLDLSQGEEENTNSHSGYNGERVSSGYTGDTSSTWDTGGAWTGEIPENNYTGSNSWSNVSYSDSYQAYYVDNDYVGGSASWVLEPGVAYTVSSEQGWRDLYGVADYHLGTDFACPAGTEIRAFNAGTVLISEYHYSYGNYVLVDHGGGLQTLYAHMAERAVSAGDWVESGQVLGYVGMTGSAYGYHLHFEVRENGETMNPRNYIDF